MISPRWRPVLLSLLAVLVVWALAMAGFAIARGAKVTPEKVTAFMQETDLSKLSAEDRAAAIRRLSDMLNGLSLEDRRQARLDRAARRWFEQMTEEEKAGFVEATLPTGFQQMLTAFEEMPAEKRQKTIDDALRRLRDARNRGAAGDRLGELGDTNAPVISEELQARIRTLGLKSFYGQSSAQTKAELAPVLEELQRSMESGRPFRRR